MKQINTIVSLYSLTALVIIIERLSPTTQILLQPHNFIRLHEVIQTNVFILITVLLSFFIIKFATKNFTTLKEKGNGFLMMLFISGVYLYGAGEGWHEVASFLFNHYCDTKNVVGNLCGGLFINDYYAGNLIFFIGGLLMNYAVLALAIQTPVQKATKKELTILYANSIVYAFTWFAYAAFDAVLVGLCFAALLMVISVTFFWKVRKKWKDYPYVTYSALAYTLATFATLLVRFR